jgi:hypothetical protein
VSDEPAAPALRVVRGDATPEEVAALLVVLQAVAPAASDAPAPRSEWAAPRRLVRAPLTAGRDAWRTSALPG